MKSYDSRRDPVEGRTVVGRFGLFCSNWIISDSFVICSTFYGLDSRYSTNYVPVGRLMHRLESHLAVGRSLSTSRLVYLAVIVYCHSGLSNEWSEMESF